MKLNPLPYHRELVDYLQLQHEAVWRSFHTAEQSKAQRADVEVRLLKSAYRLQESDHPDLYSKLANARKVLGVEQPITLYQGSKTQQDNAFMSYTREHGHLTFQGKILGGLTDSEIEALIGHEVGHFRLWAEGDGEFHTASQILWAMSAEKDVHPSIVETERLLKLYTEVYCDRAGALVAGSAEPQVAVLVKLHTGQVKVRAADYIVQAEEIFSKSEVEQTSVGSTHPEHFIRARAVDAWMKGNAKEADALVEGMIEGRKPLTDLDALGRARVTVWTDRLLKELQQEARGGKPSEAWKNHFKLFAPHEAEPRQRANVGLDQVVERLPFQHQTVRDYLVFVLLDFAGVEVSGDALSRGWSRALAERMGLGERFEQLASEHLPAVA